MLPDVDIESLYQQIDALHIDVKFTTDVGFPYLMECMANVVDKVTKATDLSIQVIKWARAAQEEESGQKALFELTKLQEHKVEANRAMVLKEKLKEAEVVLKLRRERLKGLPHDIRLYMRLMSNQMETERVCLPSEHKMTPALEGIPLTEAFTRPERVEESLDDLFVPRKY